MLSRLLRARSLQKSNDAKDFLDEAGVTDEFVRSLLGKPGAASFLVMWELLPSQELPQSLQLLAPGSPKLRFADVNDGGGLSGH